MVGWTIAFLIAAVALMVAAMQVESAETALWVAGMVLAGLAICTAFGAVMTWARRRKRLWG
jgi:hypothetical protein